jgi:CheY-like chemotaxis protein
MRTPWTNKLAATNHQVAEDFAQEAKIFLIDDEKIVTKLFEMYLQRNGFANTFAFNDSAEAIETLRFVSPDLILTDIHMPEVSGSFLTKLVRTFKHLDSVPIVAVTADSREEIRDGILRKGANSVLYKPVTESELIATVKELVEDSIDRKNKKFADHAQHKLKMKQRKAHVMSRESELRNLMR